MPSGFERQEKTITDRQLIIGFLRTAKVIPQLLVATNLKYQCLKTNLDGLVAEGKIVILADKIKHSGRMRDQYKSLVREYKNAVLKDLQDRRAMRDLKKADRARYLLALTEKEAEKEAQKLKEANPFIRLVSFSGDDAKSKDLRNKINETERIRISERKSPEVHIRSTAYMV